jgi:hypothetical protein
MIPIVMVGRTVIVGVEDAIYQNVPVPVTVEDTTAQEPVNSLVTYVIRPPDVP